MTYAEQDELAARVPALRPTKGDPLHPGEPTRLALDWDHERWAESDPATGVCLAVGEIETQHGEQVQA